MVNCHIIISDKKSIDRFVKIFNKYESMVDYFVLLPHIAQGRGEEIELAWEYLTNMLPETNKIAFGAKFYPYLTKSDNFSKKMDISLYEPEIMSKFFRFKRYERI